MNLSALKAAIRQAKSERVAKVVEAKVVPTNIMLKACMRIKCIDCKLCKES